MKENESLPDISCNATCKPKCNGTWTIDTGEFVSYDILSFPTINRNQNGSYRCNISNSVSSIISTDVSVIVTCKYLRNASNRTASVLLKYQYWPVFDSVLHFINYYRHLMEFKIYCWLKSVYLQTVIIINNSRIVLIYN